MRAGVWLVGARGSVATTTVVGALALRFGLAEPVGCVTAHPALSGAPLPGFGDLIFGGHDVTVTAVTKKAEQLAIAGVVPARLVGALGADLAAVEEELRPAPADGTQAECSSASSWRSRWRWWPGYPHGPTVSSGGCWPALPPNGVPRGGRFRPTPPLCSPSCPERPN